MPSVKKNKLQEDWDTANRKTADIVPLKTGGNQPPRIWVWELEIGTEFLVTEGSSTFLDHFQILEKGNRAIKVKEYISFAMYEKDERMYWINPFTFCAKYDLFEILPKKENNNDG